jgi:alkylation response protein AidB-like acyl-CoA dehydrogenase
MDAATVQENVAKIAARFAQDRRERQVRRHLDPADFAALAETGYLLTGVPAEMGGLWVDMQTSTRPISEILRTLARGDPSVALVSSMHPVVIAAWLIQPEGAAEWMAQRNTVFQSALDGAWWGTVTSEPGSGGDVMKTRTIARRDADGTYRISGQKHFGSGSGITSYMITSAIPEDAPDVTDIFYLDVRGVPWDGSKGMKLVAEWDGHGMTATQSHAFEFENFPVTRLAQREATGLGPVQVLAYAAFTAVITGVVQSAVEAARAQVVRKKDDLRPYELTEWANVEQEAWLIDQSYEGLLREAEAKGVDAGQELLVGKTAVAQLAESVTLRICRVIGGGSFNRTSHFGAAFEDVRALGFLRPPWGLAYDGILEGVWAREGA